ncbi:MAG: tRNA (adenosine(37)-N6)-dimethylallyltransferase MiaA [Ignavibacteriaceae bacterium]
MERKIIVIVGLTCSGKTNLGIQLAEKINGEIISADSRQIYKYLDVGTAKPSKDELEKVKHYFISKLEPDEDFNVSKFEWEALKIIEKNFENGKQPMVVGGTGLYIKALIDGIFDTVDTDEEYRKELLELKAEFGNEYLYNELRNVDPESATSMQPSNWKRIIRALEVYHLTGQRIGVHQKRYKREGDYNFVQYGLNWDRKVLYRNIENRVDEMIKSGLVEEAKEIIANGFDKKLNSLNTVGYKEIISYLEGEISLDRAIELIKRNTRRFAKRQMTWFRRDKRIKWYDVSDVADLNKVSDKIVKKEFS